MIRQRFEYHVPASVQDATALLASFGEQAEVIGGGTWVVVEMMRGARRPSHVIDLRDAGLGGVATIDGEVTIGPRTTYTELERSAQAPRLLRDMAHGITGGPQIRNQGTVGGSACYANPASDVPAVLVALGARLRLSSARGERELGASEFFCGAFACERAPDEVLSAIIVPRDRPGWGYGYEKFKLVEGSWPIVTAACVLDEGGSVVSLAIGGASATPVLVEVGVGDDPERLAQAASEAISEPWSDVLAPGKYRKAIAGVIAKRAAAAARAETEGGQR